MTSLWLGIPSGVPLNTSKDFKTSQWIFERFFYVKNCLCTYPHTYQNTLAECFYNHGDKIYFINVLDLIGLSNYLWPYFSGKVIKAVVLTKPVPFLRKG